MGGNTVRVLMAALCTVAACTDTDATLEDDRGSDRSGQAPSDDDGGTGGEGGEGGGDEGGDDGTGMTGADDTGSGGGTGSGSGGAMPGGSTTQGAMLTTGCSPYGGDVYTPFPGMGPVSTGTVTTFPWRGPTTYPDGLEDFRAYGPALPATVECGANKGARDHVDVTAGCLQAVSSGGDTRGKIQLTSDGYFRSFALPYDATNERRVAWADQGVEYSFFYSAWTGTSGNPGFKAFVRYLTEYDLYVASWRRDGVVQIQKKQCGVYTTLKRIATFGAPSLNAWHTIRFQVVGNELRLFLDGQLVITTTDDSITHGTAGIRIDSANGAQIDNWRTYAP